MSRRTSRLPVAMRLNWPRAAMATCEARSGTTNPVRCPGPVWLNGRARTTSRPRPNQLCNPTISAAALLAA